MNWGIRVLFVFVAFAGGISYMVWRCMETPVDLVSKDYYKEELAYQQVIDGTRRAGNLSQPVHLAETPAGVQLRLPAEMHQKALSGNIHFYCPADAARDRVIPLNLDPDGGQTIARERLRAGRYTVSISWETAGLCYFSQQPFIIH